MNTPAALIANMHRPARVAMAPWFGYAVVWLAMGNAVLRPSAEVPVTPFYVLAPLVIALLATSLRWFRTWLLVFIGIACYGLIVGKLFGVPWGMQFAQLAKYLQLLCFFGLLKWLHEVDPEAGKRLTKVAMGLTLLVFMIALWQALTGLEIPTVVNEESSLWLNTVFFTPNDVALFLGGVLCIVLASDASLISKAVVLALVTSLNLRNDAKAALIATALMLAMLVILRACAPLRLRPWVGLIALAGLVTLVLLYLGEDTVEIGDTETNLLALIIEPVQRIVNLEAYELRGSIFDRADALIYGLQAFKSTAYLGLGPGGSVYALSLPQYELVTAQSLHNALAEMAIEFGPAAVLVGIFVLAPLLRGLAAKRPSTADRGRLLLIAASPLLSVSQSSGFISNYAFWLTAFLIWWPIREPRRGRKS
jgi:hypothetical protein